VSQSDLAKAYGNIFDVFHDLQNTADKDKPAKWDVRALPRFLYDHPDLWLFSAGLINARKNT
jgi:hypothetical protein